MQLKTVPEQRDESDPVLRVPVSVPGGGERGFRPRVQRLGVGEELPCEDVREPRAAVSEPVVIQLRGAHAPRTSAFRATVPGQRLALHVRADVLPDGDEHAFSDADGYEQFKRHWWRRMSKWRWIELWHEQ